MCFGGKGGGGHQGGGSSQEDGEVRKAHKEAGIPAAETRRYFREKENPAHMRNKNAAGGNTSVSHSRDEGGNLVAKQVDYGQGSFAPPQGVREGDQSLAMNQQKTIRRDFIRDNKFLPDRSSLSDNLVAQNLSRTEKYKTTSDQFRGKTPGEIEAIRAANRAKDPTDLDGDGSRLTSTDNNFVVYGIGTTTNPDGSMKGDGAQPAIYDPNLPEGYRGIPQVDPNRKSDKNLTMFGKAMRTVGKPVIGALLPGAGALMLADRFSDKIPSFLTGGDAPGSANDQALLRQEEQRSAFPVPINSKVAPPTREFKSYVDSRNLNLGSLGGISPETNNIGASSASASLPSAGSPVFDRSVEDLKNMGTSTIGALSSPVFRPQKRPSSMNVSSLDDANKGETIMVDGFSDSYRKKVPVSTYFRMNDPFGDYNDDNFDQVMPPSDEPETSSSSPYFNYTEWTPSDPTYLGTSSYGGKWSTGASGVASTAPTGIYSDGGASAQVLTDFYNDKTGQYYTAPNAGFYAEAGSNWKRGRPTSSYA